MHLKTINIIISFLSLFLFSSQVWAVMELNSDTPIHVSAEKMVSHDKKNAVIFTGNVKAKQGDMIINSQEMTIYHEVQKQKNSSQKQDDSPQIEKIIATGNVEIIQEGFVATGNKVEYLAKEEKVILTGNAKIMQDNNMVTGYKIEMDMIKGTTTVTPAKDQKASTTTTGSTDKPKVEMYFFPKSDKNEIR